MEKKKPWGFVPGLILGGAVGLLAVGLLGSLLVYGALSVERKKPSAGWTLVPVVVLNRDVKSGDELAFDDVSMRSVPVQLASSSTVTVETVSAALHRKLRLPLKKSDVLRWTDLAALGDPKLPGTLAASKACTDALSLDTSGAPESVEVLIDQVTKEAR